MSDIYYYFSYSPEKPILALQKQVAENLENAPLLITAAMCRMARLLALRAATAHACCVRQHGACAMQALCGVARELGGGEARPFSAPPCRRVR